GAYWQYHTLPAMDFTGEEMLDPSKMNPTKLTLTSRSKSEIGDMQVNLPWEGAVSLHTKWENFRMNLDYSYFMRGMSVRYSLIDSVDSFDPETLDMRRTSAGEDSVDVSRGENRFRLGLKQQFALGIEVYQVFFQIGGVFYTVSEGNVLTESASYRPRFLPFLPTLNTGYHFPVGPHFTTTVSLVAFPVSLFKTSVEYRY